MDDCHSTGILGPQGRGTAAHFGLNADIITGTLGKSLGGAAGGFVAAAQPVIDMLRQRSRPYLFSNALPPMLVGGAIKAIELTRAGDDLRTKLHQHARRFRTGLSRAGFRLLDGEHPIIPVMLDEAQLAQDFANRLMSWAFLSLDFSIRSSRGVKHAYVYKCPRLCRPGSWIMRSSHFRKPVVN